MLEKIKAFVGRNKIKIMAGAGGAVGTVGTLATTAFAEGNQEASVGGNVVSAVEVGTILPAIKAGVAGVFDIASSAFSFLMANPLCAFMLCSGFAFTALSLIRRALRISKRT